MQTTKKTSKIFNLVNLYYAIAIIGLLFTWKYNLEYMVMEVIFFQRHYFLICRSMPLQLLLP